MLLFLVVCTDTVQSLRFFVHMHVEKTEINDRAECYHRYMSQGTFRMHMESETPEKVGLRRLVARRREHNKKILLLFCRDRLNTFKFFYHQVVHCISHMRSSGYFIIIPLTRDDK